MEHLIYQPSERQHRLDVRNVCRRLDGNVAAVDLGVCTEAKPLYRLLEHDHMNSSVYKDDESNDENKRKYFLDYYGEGWDVQAALDDGDLRLAHASLRDAEDSVVNKAITAFIQALLYFGLLEEILQWNIPVDLLTRTDNDSTVWLYTRNLAALFEFWRRRVDKEDEDQKTTLLQQARSAAVHANNVLADYIKRLEHKSAEPIYASLKTQLLAIEPPITALHEAITTIVNYELKSEVRHDLTTRPFVREAAERLVAKGWCPFVIASAEIAMTASFLHYLDLAGYTETVGGHQDCTSKECKRNQIDTESYEAEHYTQGCKCPCIKPNIQYIREILDANLIPVVAYDPEDNDGEVNVGAIPPDMEPSDYMAISHVWADGIGSNSEKGLPTCQVKRLHQMSLKEGVHAGYFWVDSLCIPKEPTYRRKAILSMNLNYRRASGAIVLDRSIRKLSTSSPTLQIAWTVYASGWVGRMWTYQEGFLPPWVDLELSDGLYDLYQLIQRLYKAYYTHSGSPFPHIFTRDLLASLQKLRPLDKHNLSRPLPRRIVDTFNALTRRRTSREEDQTIVLGLTLNVSIEHLMAFSGEDRFRKLYCSLQLFPWTIVFDQRPKMTMKPFRWAPKSWLSEGKDVWLHYDEALAKCSQEGLRISLTVLVFDDPISTASTTVLIDQGERQYELLRNNDSSSSSLQAINMAVVRHFSHQSPEDALDQTGSILVRVCVGYCSDSEHNELSCDFAATWQIHLTEGIMNIPDTMTVVQARWVEKDLLFT